MSLLRKNEKLISFFMKKGAEMTPWLWIGGTKEVRTLQICEMILVDTGGTSP